jgi:predicted PurR-regulated permease PerM
MTRSTVSPVFRTTLIVAATLIALLILWFAHQVFLLLFAGLLFGVFLRAVSSWVSRKLHFPISISLLLTIVTLIVAIILTIEALAPGVSQQVHELEVELPKSLEHLRTYLQQYSWGADLWNAVPSISQMTSGTDGSIFYRVTGAISHTIEIIVNVAIVFFSGIYFAFEPALYREGFLRLFPEERRPFLRSVLSDVHATLRGWLMGILAGMASIAVLIFIALEVIGIPLALTLSLLTGLLNFIPNIGSILSAVLPALLGLMIGPGTALTVILAYAGIQFLESHLITPLIQRHASRVPPVLAIAAQLSFGVLFGFLGLLLAVPLMATLIVLVDRLWVRRHEYVTESIQ